MGKKGRRGCASLLLLVVCLHQGVQQRARHRNGRTRDGQRRHRRAERDARRHDDDHALDRVAHGVLEQKKKSRGKKVRSWARGGVIRLPLRRTFTAEVKMVFG